MPKLKFDHSSCLLTKPLIDWSQFTKAETLNWQGENWENCEDFLKSELAPICGRLTSSLKKFLKSYLPKHNSQIRLKICFHPQTPSKYRITMSQGWLAQCSRGTVLLKAPRQDEIKISPHRLRFMEFKKNSYLLGPQLGPQVFISIDTRPHSEVSYSLNGLILDTH